MPAQHAINPVSWTFGAHADHSPSRQVAGRTQMLADFAFPAGRSSYSRSNTNQLPGNAANAVYALARQQAQRQATASRPDTLSGVSCRTMAAPM